MKTTLLTLLLLSVPAAAQSALPDARAPGRWESLGIGGGGALFAPSISPHDADLVYMATDMGGVFRSRDLGRHWKTLPFHELSGARDTPVRFTSDPNVLYATGVGVWDERRVMVSSDAGATFELVPNDPTDNEVFMFYADAEHTQRLLVAGWNQLHFSGDGGTSWTLAHDASGDGSGILFGGAFWDGNSIYAGTSHGMVVSHDGGASFSVDGAGGIPADQAMVSFAGAREGGSVRFFCVTYPRDNVWGGLQPWDAVYSHPRVYRLNEGDANWTQVFDGAGAERPFFVAMSANDVDVAYLAGEEMDFYSPMVLKTGNGGASWQQVLHTQGNANVATGWMGYGGDLEWYWAEVVLGLAVAPNDSDHAIITDFGFVHVTDDGGTSWRQAYVDSRSENPAGVPTPKGAAYASSGVEQTSSLWLHWATPARVIAGFSDFNGVRSVDGGHSWTAGEALGLPHNTTYHVVEHPSGTLYAATSSVHDLYQSTYLSDARIDDGEGHVMLSQDQGASWTLLHDFGRPVIWLALDPNDPERLLASVVHSSAGGVFETNNLSSGADFHALASPPRTEGHPLCVIFLDDGSLLTSWSGRRDASGQFTTSSGVFLSTDGGASWQDRSDRGMWRWTKDVVVDPHDPHQNTWYAAVFSHWGSPPNEVGGVYRTTDRGLTWWRISDLYRVDSVAIDPLDPDLAYVTTEVRGLWQTDDLTDAAPTFTRDDSFPFKHPFRLFFHPFRPGERWLTSYGGGLWRSRR